MDTPRSRKGLVLFGAILVLLGAMAYMWVLFWNSNVQIPDSSIQHAPVDRPRKESARAVPSSPPASTPAVAVVETLSNPLPQGEAKGLPPSTLRVLTARYNDLRDQGRAARGLLQEQINADPELSEVWKAKLASLDTPLLFITFAQAVEDPLLRPVMMDSFQTAIERGYPLLGHIDEVVARYGYKGRSAAAVRSGEELASLLRAIEPFAQADYHRLINKMEVGSEMARVYEVRKASEILENDVIGYMMKNGYSYYREKREFVLRK